MSRSYALFSCALMFGALSMTFAQKDAQQKPMDAERGPVEVPIGSILIWWGKATEIPEGFEVCDGLPVTTRDAVLKGKKPNLQQKFVRGAPDWRTFVPEAFVGGGQESISYGNNQTVNMSFPDTYLTAANLPPHDHPLNGMAHHIVDGSGADLDPTNPSSIAHNHYLTTAETGHADTITPMIEVPTIQAPATDNAVQTPPVTQNAYLASFTDRMVSVARWPRTVTGVAKIKDHPSVTGMSTGVPTKINFPSTATISLPSRDNRPPYLDMVFIIRVK